MIILYSFLNFPESVMGVKGRSILARHYSEIMASKTCRQAPLTIATRPTGRGVRLLDSSPITHGHGVFGHAELEEIPREEGKALGRLRILQHALCF
jgi:hypothetical protein